MTSDVMREAFDLQADIDAQAAVDATEPSLADVMQAVVERARSLTGAGGAVVELAEGDEMVYRAASGSAAGSLGLRLKLDGSLSGLCVSTGEVLHCEDTETDPRVDLDACRAVGVRSMVVAPLVHRGKAVGALKVVSSAPGGFDARAVEVVQLLAGFVGASLARARRFDELVRLNEALDGFTAHVAHDLHSPLAAVAMAAALLRNLVGDISPEVSDLVRIVEEQTAHSADLVTRLLTLARASRTPRRESFQLAHVVDEAARCIPGVRLENRCGETTVVADRTAVRQAVANLLSNGARHAAVGGQAVLTVQCEESPDGWRVLVSDRGPGVPVEDADRLFSAFERGRQAATDGGSGLGLAIVTAMAQAHGGEAGYEPRPGGGSVFWFSLARAGEA